VKDDRLRIPIDDPYLDAIGLAIIAFARLEWSAVWCCESLDPGYIQTVTRKTAGEIAWDLVKRTNGIEDRALRDDIALVADKFKRLVETRNALLHGKPGTAKNGKQRLFRDGTEWTIERVNEAADMFAECDMRLNAIYHERLKAL